MFHPGQKIDRQVITPEIVVYNGNAGSPLTIAAQAVQQ